MICMMPNFVVVVEILNPTGHQKDIEAVLSVFMHALLSWIIHEYNWCLLFHQVPPGLYLTLGISSVSCLE